MDLFQRLQAHHGPQNWWPADSHFEMIVGAILTQNTSWKNVETALQSLQRADVWSFSKILDIPESELADLIRSSGYYNQKARKLRAFATVVENEFSGSSERLFDLPTVELRARLLAMWGIGEETADDIVLYGAGKPVFVVDRYTMRLLGRLGWRVAGECYADYQTVFMDILPADAELFGEYHALIDRHCSTTCKSRPMCQECCLADICLSRDMAPGD
jgi:endonuclease-3 related protein